MSYTDEIQTPEEAQRQRQTLIIVAIIVAIVLIGGCAGIFFLLGNRPAPTQGQTIVAVTSLPTLTPSLTPIPSDTLEPTPGDGIGGGGDGATETPSATNTDVPSIRFATLSEIRGSVLIKTPANSDWVTVTSELTIPEGTTILTSEGSSVKLTTTEGTTIRVSSQTQIVLAELRGTTLDPLTKLKIDFGKVWAIVGNDLGLGKFEVETPIGLASLLEGSSFMGVEHNSTQILDIITCLDGKCRYANSVGVIDLATLQQVISDGGGVPGPVDPMDPNQVDSWSPTRVPEVVTLTPTITPTFTPSVTRTPTNTRTPVNTPNFTATQGAAGTNSAQTSTAASNQLTQTVSAINLTATAGAGSTSGAKTATAAVATANQNATNISGTANANATNQFFTATAFAVNIRLTNEAATARAAASQFALQTAFAQQTETAFASANPSNTPISTPTKTATPLPAFSFSTATYSAGESAGKVTITINLNATLSTFVSVQLDTAITGSSSLDATSGADFTPIVSQIITFNPNQTSRNIDITLIDDGLTESNETFQVLLTNPGPQTALGTPSGANVTINDSPPPVLAFSTPAYTAPEGNAGTTNAAIIVNLSRAYANTTTVTVDYSSFAGGTATGGGACGGGVDYVTPAGTLTFVPGVLTQTFNLAVCGDTLNEQDETVFLQLTNETNTAAGGVDTATLTITNDDLQPTVNITPGTVAVVEPGGLGATSILTFDVTLSTASGQTITVDYATVEGSGDGFAKDGADYVGKTTTTLTFPPNTVGPQTISITIKGDVLNEMNESFDLVLSNAIKATLLATPNDRSTATITDDGDPAPVASFSLSPYTKSEGNSGTSTATISVNLSRQSGQTIILGYSTTPGGSCGANVASAGSDYVTANGQLTYNPGDLSASFAITINGDAVVEPDECLTLNLSAVAGTVTITGPSELWIMNDD
ncbi:MAG: FecR domain-containing protein [Chloroflexi bacterium]|nr:FecR domain-containing protein [Chloroflexota bacterium]